MTRDTKHPRRALTALLLLAPLFGGCTAQTGESDVGEIEAALELDNGGLTMEDELPAFGMEESFAELALLEEDPALVDPIEAEPELVAMREAPDAALIDVAIEWGQIPGDRENETPRDWSGALVVSRGGIIVRRTTLFEPETDRLLPRPGPQILPFASVTRPHHDGLVITIVDPAPGAPEPLVLAYVAGLPGPGEAPPAGPPPADGDAGAPPPGAPLPGPADLRVLPIPLHELLGGPRELARDEAGNRMIAVAHARPIDVCERGFVGGRWHRVAEGRGRFMGRVVGPEGALLGHVRGLYGVRRDGSQVFFGKIVGREGAFRGILAGHYGDGRFEGAVRTLGGETGRVEGVYREDAPGPEVGGHFMGRFGETRCDVRL